MRVTNIEVAEAGKLSPTKPPSDVELNVLVPKKFGSAEKSVEAEVADDIAECDRLVGVDDFFDSQEEKMRQRLPAAYKAFRRAAADPHYCRVLQQKLLVESGGKYRPSDKKPWVLAVRMALKPKTKTAESATYEAAYFYRRALIEQVPVERFKEWIEGRNLKEDRDFVRARNKPDKDSTPKVASYPNHAKARALKGDAEVNKILKASKDLAEEELAKLFAGRAKAGLNAQAAPVKAA